MKLKETLRRYKFTYEFYNFFNKKKLNYNTPLYKKIGLKKKYYSSISNHDFKDIDENLLKKNNVTPIEKTSLFKEASAETQLSLSQFHTNGYTILPKYIDDTKIEAINSTIDKLLSAGQIKFGYQKKLMDVIRMAPEVKAIGEDERLIELLSSLLKGRAKLFQSINFLYGSQQKTHSDSIHMTTFPLGGLLGFWIALEDIHLDNGPLHYYPGSHTLPYYLNEDYNNIGTKYKIGDKLYSEYEKMITKKLSEKEFDKQLFLPKKGDVLIWHANLFHGGETHINSEKTRKSMVFHYYNTECICYHEISQRPALMH